MSGARVHDEVFSLYARQHFKDMGVPAGTRIQPYQPLSDLQIEERRRKVPGETEVHLSKALWILWPSTVTTVVTRS